MKLDAPNELTLDTLKNVEFATAFNAKLSCTHNSGITPINWKNKKTSSIPHKIMPLVNGCNTCTPYSYPNRLSEMVVGVANPNAPKNRVLCDAERK